MVSMLVALALGITLALVASRSGTGALTTTALALAVIAFGAQLLVYIAQVADSADTRLQASEVNTATQASLARIGTTVASSDQMIREQNTRVLDELLGFLRRRGAEQKDADSPLTAADVLGLIEDRASSTESARSRRDEGDDESFGTSEPSEFESWPSEHDGRRVYATLKRLDQSRSAKWSSLRTTRKRATGWVCS